MLVSDGVVYATALDDADEHEYLYALDAGTGKALWRAAIDVTGVAQTANNGRVFIASGSYRPDPCTPPRGVGYVYALDAGTGAVLWRYQTGTQMG
jgi:outer membrane protein assembly factor BamB